MTLSRLDLYKSRLTMMRPMHAFDVLGDPVRRRILELLADGEQTSGAIGAVVQAEFGISQPAVSQHLKVLRESGFATVRPEGARRLYAVDAAPLARGRCVARPVPPLLGATSRLARDRAGPRQARAPTARRTEHPSQGGPHPMIDVVKQIEAVQREVGSGTLAAGEARAIRLRRTYDAPIEDVWDALTDPERIGRWFLPISGDYRIGGRYQFEGNAGGEIVACERPHRLRATWVYGEAVQPGRRLRGGASAHAVGDAARRRSSSSTSRSCPRSSGPCTGRARSASAGRAGCSDWRCTCSGGSVGGSDRLAVVGRGPGLQHEEQPGLGRRVHGRRRGSSGRRDDGREHDPVLRTGSGGAVLRTTRARQGGWWRWGRVELPVQNPSSETTTSVSDGLSSTARTGIGTLPGGPVTCP